MCERESECGGWVRECGCVRERERVCVCEAKIKRKLTAVMSH